MNAAIFRSSGSKPSAANCRSRRTETERVAPEDARVADAHEGAGRSLRERPNRGTALHVRVLKLGGHALHLIDDRREEELDRLDRGEAVADHERADRGVDVLRIT